MVHCRLVRHTIRVTIHKLAADFEIILSKLKMRVDRTLDKLMGITRELYDKLPSSSSSTNATAPVAAAPAAVGAAAEVGAKPAAAAPVAAAAAAAPAAAATKRRLLDTTAEAAPLAGAA
jgi:hypothetical protein